MVTAIKKKGFEVSCMQPCGLGSIWNWPEKPDKGIYLEKDILAVIKTPNLLNSRNQFSIPELEDIW